MEKEITYKEFEDKVSEFWNTERHMYGSVYYPAMQALEYFQALKISNAQELYALYKHRKGALFHYAGD
jgi:hypothetical protein